MHDVWVMVLGAGWTGLKALGQFIKDFQSLLAGLMAVGAAWIAIRPVHRQLHVSRVQAAIASREVLFGRTRTINQRRTVAEKAILSITSDFTARLYQGDPEGEPDIQPEWASDAAQLVGQVIDQFERQQTGMGDREAIEEGRASVIQAATALQNCLTHIHQFYSYDFDSPDNKWSQKEIDENRAAAEAASKDAERQLEARISAVAQSGKELDNAYGAELAEIGARVLQINKLVLKEDHSAS